MRNRVGFAFWVGLFWVHLSQSSAILIATGSGNSASTSIPNLNPGVSSGTLLNAVGQAGPDNASVVYLGNGYVITARHVGELNVVLGGHTYDAVGPATQIGTSDLIVYKVADRGVFPSVTPLQITTAAPFVGQVVTAIGYGEGAGSIQKAEGAYTGYDLGTDQGVTQRWGQGTLAPSSVVGGNSSPAAIVPLSSTVSSIDVFSQYYQSAADEMAQVAAGNTNEFLLTGGDSGGALVGTDGTLAGILEVTFPQPGQPSNSGTFGETSGAVSLYYYRSQIEAIIAPEPASLGLLGVGMLGLLARRRRIDA